MYLLIMRMRKIGNSIKTNWTHFLMAAVVCATVAGCVAEEYENETGTIITRLNEAPDSSEQIKFEGELVVHSTDVLRLSNEVQGATSESERKDIVAEYLKSNENIQCILDDIQLAANEEKDLNCGGNTLVSTSGGNGLLGITDMVESLNTRESVAAKRELLIEYLDSWGKVQRVSRVVDSLDQISRTHALPILGSISRKIHNFPILYEGDVLVPTGDIPSLLEQFEITDAKDAKRNLVTSYLRG